MSDGKVEKYNGGIGSPFVSLGDHETKNIDQCTVKHEGSSIMLWACFSYYGVGPLHWINTIMDQLVYVDILQNVMLPYAEVNAGEMPFIWVFQQVNAPKHTS